MIRRAITFWLVGQGAFALGLGLAILTGKGGRPLANAHPDVRGGGDAGFGGTVDRELGVGAYGD